MKEVHIVVAGNYDSFCMIRAFADNSKACQLARECNEYQKLVPLYEPNGVEAEQYDAWFKVFDQDIEKWQESHPIAQFGEYFYIDSSPYCQYSVQTVTVEL